MSYFEDQYEEWENRDFEGNLEDITDFSATAIKAEEEGNEKSTN